MEKSKQKHSWNLKTLRYNVLIRALCLFTGVSKARPIEGMYSNYDFKEQKAANGRSIYTIKSLKHTSSNMILIYLHSGGYVFSFSDEEWYYMGMMADELGCTVITPDYPLATSGNYKDVFDMLVPMYREIVKAEINKKIVIVGASAGAGIGLALCQLLSEKGMPLPERTILISPPMDLTCENPEIDTVQKDDFTLTKELLYNFGYFYSGGDNIKNHLISPIYGSFQNLNNISVFTGTYDILYPDAAKAVSIAKAQGCKIDYHEYADMTHVWPLMHRGCTITEKVIKRYKQKHGKDAEFLMDEAARATNEILDMLKLVEQGC